MTLLENDLYIKADITGKESAVKTVVDNFVESKKGSTEDEQRVNLPYIKKHYLLLAIDYVMAHLPDGVDRVDGACIRPLLDEVCNAKINALPIIEPEEV